MRSAYERWDRSCETASRPSPLAPGPRSPFPGPWPPFPTPGPWPLRAYFSLQNEPPRSGRAGYIGRSGEIRGGVFDNAKTWTIFPLAPVSEPRWRPPLMDFPATLPATTDDIMRRRVLHAVGATCLAARLFLFLGSFSSAAVAQQATTLAVSSRSLQIEDLLRQGQQLESQRRWGEALTHYEDALRLYPAEGSLERRFESARLHYDLGRRYADRSFCQSLAQFSAEKALDLYSAVLLKIQTHYVEEPNWRALIARSSNDFDVALGEPAFREQNIPARDWQAVEPFRLEARKTLAARTVSTRQDACDAVAALATLAQQRLEMRPAATILECLCGAADGLDPYSTYLTPDQLGEVYSQIEGNFVGLGVELKTQGGELAVVRVISGSPAEQGGVHAGDRILAVNGRSVAAMPTDRAANMLQGRDGTTVALTLAAPGQSPRCSAFAGGGGGPQRR